MSFTDEVASLDSAVAETFGLPSATPLTLHFAVAPLLPLDVLRPTVMDPALEEDYVPGSAQGTAVLILFIHLATGLVNYPVVGDTATINGIDYDIFDLSRDLEGATKLKLRRRKLAWNA